tara:strand:- start:1368 stop:2240 length:873 start_codon:yes stop_codon:yes gene_type:complete
MKPISALCALVLLACAPAAVPVPEPAPHPLLPASALLDCARIADVTLVSAHRGGPAPGVPDNSLAALRRSASLGAAFAEIDLRWTGDGHIVLMHDETLDRTTTGRGQVADHTLSELQTLQLRDAQGRPTGETIPSLDDAFAVSVETGILLQLDPKTVRPVQAARAALDAGMADRVVIITYNEADAVAVQAVAPNLAISVPLRNERDLMKSDLRHVGIISWLSGGIPDARLELALTELGMESSAHDFDAESRGRANYAAFSRAHIELMAINDVEEATRILGRAGDHCPSAD